MITPEMLRDSALRTAAIFPEAVVSTSRGSKGKMVRVLVDVNRNMTVKAASDMLAAFTTDLRRSLPEGSINVVKRDGHTTLRVGYHHMGHFCTEALTRTFFVASYEGREADIEAVLVGRGGASW